MENEAQPAPAGPESQPVPLAPRPQTVPITLQGEPLRVTTETDWLPLLLGFIPAILAAVAAILIWRVSQKMACFQKRMVDLESRPSLQIMVERTPREDPNDLECSEWQWLGLQPEEKFRGLLVTNKGRGPAILESLNYPGAEEPISLEKAPLPVDVTEFFPCQGLIKGLLKVELKECFILYADPLGKNHRQYFRINMEYMTAVPLRCEDV